jgi:hypothetical protein
MRRHVRGGFDLGGESEYRIKQSPDWIAREMAERMGERARRRERMAGGYRTSH